MHQILKTARQVAVYGSNICITGESGTGKDLLANFIHQSSPRRSHPFIKVDCVAIPTDLIESELFGHEKGAFTGASHVHIGKLEQAHLGTIFLDQVTEIPLLVQSKLTRVLQERCFERIGGNETISIDIQLISASRFLLSNKVREGVFREDLFFRLNILPIHMPPLRSRRGDIPLLAKYFLDKFAAKHNLPSPRLHSQTLNLLCAYHWPGNIRELENLMERLIITFSGETEISVSQLPVEFERFDEDTLDALSEHAMSLDEVEKLYIQKILHQTKGNKSTAAKILGINRKTLLEKRKKYLLI